MTGKFAKYTRRPARLGDIEYGSSPYVGFVWPVISQRTGEHYEVEMTDRGFTCTCRGFAMHGHCKHMKQIAEKFSSDAAQYAIR